LDKFKELTMSSIGSATTTQTEPPLFLVLRRPSKETPPAQAEPPARSYRVLSPVEEKRVAQCLDDLEQDLTFKRIVVLAQRLRAAEWLEEFSEIAPDDWEKQADALVFLLDEVIPPQALDLEDECREILDMILPPEIDPDKFIEKSRKLSSQASILEAEFIRAEQAANAVLSTLSTVVEEIDDAGDQNVADVNKELHALRDRSVIIAKQLEEEIDPVSQRVNQLCEKTEAIALHGIAIESRMIEQKKRLDELAKNCQQLVREFQ